MTRPVPWRQAWEAALYGLGGFYRSGARPAAHFRTSVHASPLFAGAILTLARGAGLDTVVDVGAGGGELLRDLHGLDPDLRLHGVDLSTRPAHLPAAVEWSDSVPAGVGLLIANEWLDNVPCEIVEATGAGPRLVLVDPATGAESAGPAPERADAAWLDRWWPLDGVAVRAEVGRTRDEAWAGAVGRIRRGLAIAIDYAHDRGTRPPLGSISGFRDGRAVPPVPDGSCDITASVALDSCASAAPGESVIVTQRAALRALGISGRIPPYALSRTDPARYSRSLRGATEAAELIEPHGLGGFGWLVHAIDVPVPDLGQ